MPLRRIETVPYALPFREPYVTARGALRERELLLVRLHADEATGVGETTSLSLRGGPASAEIEREVVELWPLLEDNGVDLDATRGTIDRIRNAGISHQALAGVELALWDLCGKAAGDPVWRLLGASRATPVRCNATLVAGAPDEVARDAARWAERGFRTFKLKVGIDGDVEQVEVVRRELGENAALRLDANGAWSETDAVSKLERLSPLGIELAEEPVSGLDALARLRSVVDVPIYADESVSGWQEATLAAGRRACDGATVKLAKVGGISGALDVARHLPVYLSSALEGPVGIAAAAHTVQLIADAGLAHGLATQHLFDDTILASGCRFEGDLLHLPDAPGLGVELDEGALARHRK